MTFSEYDRGILVRMDDGSLVERDVLNVVQKIADYDPNIQVQYLEHAAKAGDAPYRLVENCPDGCRRVLFYCWRLDDVVLERIFAADTRKTDVLAALDKNNNAVRAEQKRRYKDQMGEAADIVTTYLKSRLGRWSIDDKVTGKRILLDDTPNYKAKVERTD